MRQLFLEKGNAVVKEVCQPLLDEYSVLVSVHYSFISSGTEVATINNAQASLISNVPYKIKKVLESVKLNGIEATKALIKGKLSGELQAIGYSCSGSVIATGAKVRNVRPGDWVACAGSSLANHADMVCVPEHLVVRVENPEHLKAASLTTIGAIALQGIRRANPQLGETVCVLGLGLLGQITVQLAKLSGCTVIGIDLVAERLDLAKKMGADHIYNAADPQIKKEIEFATQQHGVDCTIITAASKSDAIIQQAMEFTRRKGKVVLVGDVGMNVSRDPLYKKEIDFLISCSYGPGRYDALYEQKGQDYPLAYVRWTEQRNLQAFVQLIEQKKISADLLITAETDLANVPQAYEKLKNRQALGIVLNYGPKEDVLKSEHQLQKPVHFVPAARAQWRVGFVGAGGFAKIKLMPIIARLESAKINAVVDADIATSMNVSNIYGAARALTADDELFSEDLVDVVVIASPHKFHCDQAIKALRHGKAVFLEKPMVTDKDQLQRFVSLLATYPNAPICVDYNRSFAPYVQKIKKEVAKRHSPLVVHYRMNAGFIPKEHWVQTDIGAGRIIGEACHIVDLFCYLTDSKPVSVSVEAVHASTNNIFPTDNFSAQIRFADGSICTLLYTALGHAQLGKERMELFFDSKTIVMDDFTQLHGFGFPSTFNETTLSPDKGHETLLTMFFKHLNAPAFEPPISFDRLKTTAELTLIIDQLACEGGGEKQLCV